MRRRALGVAVLVAGLLGGQATPAGADTVRETQWHLRYLNVAEAHKHSLGDGIVVAVLDSGVDATHPDLSGNVLPAVSAIGGDDTAQSDSDGQGTALAGLIAAHGHGTDGGDGVLGLAPRAKILPVVIAGPAAASGKGPAGDPDSMAKGIQLALQRGARVICVGRSVPPSQALLEALADALRANVIIVAADGDRAGVEFPTYPSAFPGVVAAAPMNRDLSVTVTSGSRRALALAVPGAEITSTATRGGYRIDSGGAAGILAGAVTLVRAKYPLLPADEVVHRLTATAADAGPAGPDDVYGNGRLNLGAALTASVPLSHPDPSAAAGVVPTPLGSNGVGVAAGRSGRRPMGWLVLLPLLAVFGVLGWYVFQAERRIPARPGAESAGSGSVDAAAPGSSDAAAPGSSDGEAPGSRGAETPDSGEEGSPGSGDSDAPESGKARPSGR